MKIKLWALPLLAAFCLASCSNEEAELTSGTNTVNETKSLNALANTLEFSSEAEFNDLVATLSKMSDSSEKSQWMHMHYPAFRSIRDVYNDAMVEADTMGDSDDDYNKFMGKYADLYFPLYQEDAGFYIPIKDENMAFLANPNCEVKIAGETVNLRDVNDYQTLMALGVAYYAEPAPMAAADTDKDFDTFIEYGRDMNSVGTEFDSGWNTYNNSRRVKLKARRRVSNNVSKLHFEFCFRKKKPRGWVNYSSNSTLKGTVKLANTGQSLPVEKSISGRSSHDFEIECPVHLDNRILTFLYLDCTMNVQYQGIPQALNYKWPMKAVICYTYRPKPDGVYIKPTI